MDRHGKPATARRRRAWAPCGVIAAALAGGPGHGARRRTAEPDVRRHARLRAQPGAAQSLNPIVGAADNGSIFIINQICDGLVRGRRQPDAQPGLAESWTSSEDGLTWTFTLREGAMFRDGTPVTAEDVKFSLDRWADPDVNVSVRRASRAASRR